MGEFMRVAALLVCAVFVGGCATIVKGTTQSVSLDTPGVPGATCVLSSEGIGTQTVKTPATFVLDKSQHNVTVRCRKECYQDGVGVIGSYGEGMTAGNILVGGVVGLGVDAATGAMNKYADRTSIVMIPIEGCAA